MNSSVSSLNTASAVADFGYGAMDVKACTARCARSHSRIPGCPAGEAAHHRLRAAATFWLNVGSPSSPAWEQNYEKLKYKNHGTRTTVSSPTAFRFASLGAGGISSPHQPET